MKSPKGNLISHPPVARISLPVDVAISPSGMVALANGAFQSMSAGQIVGTSTQTFLLTSLSDDSSARCPSSLPRIALGSFRRRRTRSQPPAAGMGSA